MADRYRFSRPARPDAEPVHRRTVSGAARRHARIAIGLAILAMAGAACGAKDQSPSRTFDPSASVDPLATLAPLPTGNGNLRGPLRLNRIVFNDPAAGGIAAISVLVPDGWSYEGGVQWLPTWRRGAFLQTHLNEARSGIDVRWLPIQDFIWFKAPAGLDAPLGSNYQGKVYLPPITDPATFVSKFWVPGDLPELRAAQLVSVDKVPGVAREFLLGFGGPADAYAYRIRYQYVENGRSWDEDVSFALLYSGSPDLTSWYVNFAYAVRAPTGGLDGNAGLISTLIASRATTPQWEATYRLVQNLFTQGIQQQMADTVAFGQTLARHRAESEALQAQVTQERLASQDRIAALRRETLGGVTTYADPVNGGLVELPVGWNTYWVNAQGAYLTSDQAGFDPNTLNQGFWQQLQPHSP